MTEPAVPLTDLSEAQRAQAYARLRIIRPAVEDGISQAQIARTHNVPASTVQRWVKRYREQGIAGLADAGRSDKGTSRRLHPGGIALVKELALQTPLYPVAEIHRQVTAIAQEQGWIPPSYARVRQIFVDTHIMNIARLAGVSAETVSHVLDQKPDVDPIIRKRILQIVEEQGFMPNIATSGLRKRSRLLGVLVPALTWPLIPEIMRGVGDVIEATPYELILYSITEANHEKDRSDVIDRIVGTKLASGLLAIFPGPSSRHLGELHQRDFPVVLLDDQRLPPENTPWISADNRVGAYEATRHLISLGHRRIAHIQGPLKYRVSHERYEGYCQALRDAGIPIDPALVMQGDFMPAGGRDCAYAFFELPERPTAIFAASDYMAYGVMAATEEYGLRIPDDLALVGFDDLPASAHMQPALTTVKQPFFEMGQRGIELLLSLVDSPRPVNGLNGYASAFKSSKLASGMSSQAQDEPVRMQLATNLVVRASCGASQRLTIPS